MSARGRQEGDAGCLLFLFSILSFEAGPLTEAKAQRLAKMVISKL